MNTYTIVTIFGAAFAIGLLVAVLKMKSAIRRMKKFDELLKRHDKRNEAA